MERVQNNGNCLIVVCEGAFDALIPAEKAQIIEKIKEMDHDSSAPIVSQDTWENFQSTAHKFRISMKLSRKGSVTKNYVEENPLGMVSETVELASFMEKDLKEYARENHQIQLKVRMIDLRQMLRSCLPNANDMAVCTSLAESAVHSAMNGYTDFAVGLVRS